MASVLEKVDYELFKKQFPEYTEKQFAKLEQNILFLYEDSVELCQRLVERGFTEGYKNINPTEWFRFISKMMPKIERMRGMKLGKDKLELLVGFIIFVIIRFLPIGPFEKELLIIIISEFVPEITEALIYTSKKLHTLGAWLKKKIKCCN